MVLEKPGMIQIESSTVCNACCYMCPHDKLNRKRGNMTDNLFLKIVNESAELGIKKVLPFLNGEPLIFPRLFNWMEVLSKNRIHTDIFTNASVLDENKAKQLIEYEDIIDSIVFSIAGNAKTMRENSCLDFSTVKHNISQFSKLSNGKIKTMAHMCKTSRTIDIIGGFRDTFDPMVDKIGITPFRNFAGLVSDPEEPKENEQNMKVACGRLNHMTVLWDGRVCLCCMDAQGQVILGDLNTQSVSEVYNSGAAKKYRDFHQQGRWNELELCRNCNMNLSRRPNLKDG